MQKFTCHFLLILLTYFFCHEQLQIVADIVSIFFVEIFLCNLVDTFSTQGIQTCFVI